MQSIVLLSSLLILHGGSMAGGQRFLQYQSPLPGSRYVTRESTVLLRFNAKIAGVGADNAVHVVGSVSGEHPGKTIVADGGRALIFVPSAPFADGEQVSVSFDAPVELETGQMVTPDAFRFTVAPSKVEISPAASLEREMPGFERAVEMPVPQPKAPGPQLPEAVSQVTDSLPLDYPQVSTRVMGQTAAGRIFISNLGFNPQIANVPYLMILDNAGQLIFYRRMKGICLDFKIQPNGLLTYFDYAALKYYAMDSTYAIVDSFKCGNGYKTDLHELRLLPNGHALLMSYDNQKVDMSTIVAGGNPHATVTGLIVQELDSAKNVVFQWRSWDHFQITDATHENLQGAVIDYVHGNAIEVDTDGNFIISSRHMDEITKIDRTTGDIIWRFGGKNNEFAFEKDSIKFSHQHAIRRLDNGNFIMFDNGNFHTPQFTRILEYKLDQQNKTAQLMWQYRHAPDVYSQAMGYAQRLPNGNTLVGWGATNPTVTEVDSNGTPVFELAYDPGIYSYRAFRFPWKPDVSPAMPIPQSFYLSQNYPNPFNSATTIVLGFPTEVIVSFRVYDILGRRVMTVLDGMRRSPGEYYVHVDASQLPSGIYFYRVSTQQYSQMRKMIVMK